MNIVKVNLFSISTKPPSSHVIKVWDKILENHFGRRQILEMPRSYLHLMECSLVHILYHKRNIVLFTFGGNQVIRYLLKPPELYKEV